MVTTKMATMVQKSLDDILRTSFHNTQSGMRSVFYNVVEKFMLDPLRKDVFGQMLDAHIAKSLDTDTAAEGFSRRFLASNLFMAPIATFLKCKTETVVDKQYSVTYAPKGQMDTMTTLNDDSKARPSHSNPGDDEVPRRKSLNRRLEHHHSWWRRKDLNTLTPSTKSSKEKYNISSETKSKDAEQFTHKRHATRPLPESKRLRNGH